MNFFLIFEPLGLYISQADTNGLLSCWDQWLCFMCAHPIGGSGFPLAGIGEFLTRELYWQRRNSLLQLQKKGGGGGSKMEETEQTWTMTVHFQMENTEAKSKRWGYRWLRQKWVWETKQTLGWCRKCMLQVAFQGTEQSHPRSILTSNRSRNKHFFYILMGSQMKEMSKSGGKEKTNKN